MNRSRIHLTALTVALSTVVAVELVLVGAHRARRLLGEATRRPALPGRSLRLSSAAAA